MYPYLRCGIEPWSRFLTGSARHRSKTFGLRSHLRSKAVHEPDASRPNSGKIFFAGAALLALPMVVVLGVVFLMDPDDGWESDPASIRGREQAIIEKNGGAQKSGGTSGNKINGISPRNRKGETYRAAAKKEFGE